MAPLLIVLSALIVDLVNKQAFNLTPLRPCYAGYLPGCDLINSQNLTALVSAAWQNQTQSIEFENAFFNKSSQIKTKENVTSNRDEEYIDIDDVDQACEELNRSQYPTYMMVMGGSCWIHSGTANLLFFGLPIAIIIVVNAVYYFLTIYNIRKKKASPENERNATFLASQTAWRRRFEVLHSNGRHYGFHLDQRLLTLDIFRLQHLELDCHLSFHFPKCLKWAFYFICIPDQERGQSFV